MALIRSTHRALRPYNLTLGTIPVWLAGLVIALVWAMPFVWMVSTSFKHAGEVMTVDVEWLPRNPTFENYQTIFAKHPIGRWLVNSLIVAVISTGLNIVFGAMAGYALARLKFPGRNALFLLFVASLMVPQEVIVVCAGNGGHHGAEFAEPLVVLLSATVLHPGPLSGRCARLTCAPGRPSATTGWRRAPVSGMIRLKSFEPELR